MTAYFYAASFVMWLSLAAIWVKSDLHNTLIKISLFLMAAWSGFYVYHTTLIDLI